MVTSAAVPSRHTTRNTARRQASAVWLRRMVIHSFLFDARPDRWDLDHGRSHGVGAAESAGPEGSWPASGVGADGVAADGGCGGGGTPGYSGVPSGAYRGAP